MPAGMAPPFEEAIARRERAIGCDMPKAYEREGSLMRIKLCRMLT